MTHRRGFTLIEVLVVIVIIGMIAALIFPVLAKARGAAEKTTCISNLRELALASSIYLHDNDDMMFPYGYNSGSRFLTWWGDLITGEAEHGLIYPYTKSGRIRGCPAAGALPTSNPKTYTMGYGVNFRLFYNYPPAAGPVGFTSISMSDVLEPTETLLMADAAMWDQNANRAIGTAWLIGDSWCYHLHARHVGDVANVVWIDGHATSHRLDYAKVRQGEPPFSVEAKDLVANRLGELLRYPRTDPNSPTMSDRDQYYFLLDKSQAR